MPSVTIYDSAGNRVVNAKKIPVMDRFNAAGLFGLNLFLCGLFAVGRFGVGYNWTIGGFTGKDVQHFDVIPSGHKDGAVIAMYDFQRRHARFSGLSANDTMSSHSGWNESTAYSELVRQTWVPGAVSGQLISSSSLATFTANATVTIAGAFLVSNSTKGGNAGVLWATGTFSVPQSLVSGQTLKVTYSCSASGS